jgi:hypothetical protein
MQRFLFAAVIAGALSAAAPMARAQAEDQAAARALFDDARRLILEKNYEAACPKFEAARKLYSSAGTLLNLAECYEHAGRTASAWATLGEAAAVAGRTNRPDGVVAAKAQQAALAPNLVRLTIRVSRSVPKLMVRRDGLEVAQGAWGEPIPVDPGAHEILAEAEGYQPWTQSILVLGAGHTSTIEIPELRPAAAAHVRSDATGGADSPSAASPIEPAAPFGAVTRSADSAAPASRAHRIVALTTGGVGALGLVAAGVMIVLAKSQHDVALTEHGEPRVNDSANAVHLANTATAVVIVGGVLTAGGAVLWLTLPGARTRLGTTGQELVLWGSF